MPLLELFHHLKIYQCIGCLKDFIFTRDDETRDPILSELFPQNIGITWFEACNEINIATCIFTRFSSSLYYDKLFNIVVGKSYVAKYLARQVVGKLAMVQQSTNQVVSCWYFVTNYLVVRISWAFCQGTLTSQIDSSSKLQENHIFITPPTFI